MPLCIAWPHCAHFGLGKRSHRNCATLVGSRDKQGGEGEGEGDIESERIKHAYVDDKMV